MLSLQKYNERTWIVTVTNKHCKYYCVVLSSFGETDHLTLIFVAILYRSLKMEPFEIGTMANHSKSKCVWHSSSHCIVLRAEINIKSFLALSFLLKKGGWRLSHKFEKYCMCLVQLGHGKALVAEVSTWWIPPWLPGQNFFCEKGENSRSRSANFFDAIECSEQVWNEII